MTKKNKKIDCPADQKHVHPRYLLFFFFFYLLMEICCHSCLYSYTCCIQNIGSQLFFAIGTPTYLYSSQSNTSHSQYQVSIYYPTAVCADNYWAQNSSTMNCDFRKECSYLELLIFNQGIPIPVPQFKQNSISKFQD